jgi:catechol 2,3-dioxygenase-like lactoylglutathione lyase family enzyme
MSGRNKSYVEHVAIKVRDIDWHIRFFDDVLGMSVRETIGHESKPEKVWTIGGIQIDADPDFNGPEGHMAHLGIMVENLEEALAKAYRWDVRELPMGRHWLMLPDGLVLELMQACGNAVAEALAIKPYV